MQRLAKRLKSSEWIENMEHGQRVFRIHEAARIDFQMLTDLALGRIETQNSVEKKVKEIMVGYLERRQAPA